jgi:hypothetical protein
MKSCGVRLASYIALACASFGCGAPNPSTTVAAAARVPASGPFVTDVVAQYSPSPWPTLKRLPGPPRWDEYHPDGSRPSAIWEVDGDKIQVLPLKRPSDRVDPLPFEVPPELDATQFAGAQRTVVPVDNGWLVAIDGGEFSMGLYWVNSASRETRSLDRDLLYPIGWVGLASGASGDSPLAVAGMCHGEGCTHQTTVYELLFVPDRGWRLSPKAVIEGCPGAVTQSSDRRALVIASDCGTLNRLDERRSVEVVGAWPHYLFPQQVIVSENRDDTESYFVSFGEVLARFSEGQRPEWFEPLLP